jgi:tRNA (cmo5U34)-methyltransferase
MPKSTVDEIRARFDADVERFSNLETGQSATIDAPLVMELVTQAAAAATPGARRALDVGCGAGNYSLKLLERLPRLEMDLVDLSRPMLDRAAARVGSATPAGVRTFQADIRELELEAGRYDVITAAAVLHHLRSDDEWAAVFAKLHRALRPGGSLWISDLVLHSDPHVHEHMWRRYGEYLAALKGEDYRDHVFAYIEKEDTPRPLLYQIDLLRSVGFHTVDVLHKNSVFAAFGGIRAPA